MIIWCFYVAAFGFLWAVRLSDSLKPGEWKEGLGRLFFECVELYFQTALLTGIYLFAGRTFPEISMGSFFPLFFLMGAYLFQLFRPKDEFFFLMVFSLGIFYVSPAFADLKITDPFLSLAAMVTLIFIYTALFLGLKKRLLFSHIPRQLEGLPLELFSAALLALGIWAFQGIVP